jgi:hypothetical protein
VTDLLTLVRISEVNQTPWIPPALGDQDCLLIIRAICVVVFGVGVSW